MRGKKKTNKNAYHDDKKIEILFHKYQVTTGVSKIFLQLKISTAWFAICRAGDWALMKSLMKSLMKTGHS